MSGFEVAGIVLAVLPLFSDAGKARAKALGQAVSPSKYDKELQEFYDLFWYETFELHTNIVKVVRELPGLSDERKQEVIQNVDLDKWDGDQASDVATALNEFLEADDYVALQKIMAKVSRLLARLTKDGTVRIAKSEKNHRLILAKLKALNKDCAPGSIFNGLWDRFRFHKQSQDRTTCLENLKTWRNNLSNIVDRVCRAEYKRNVLGTKHIEQGPSSRLRSLSRKLFNALSSRWSCSCDAPHEARFCIATCGSNTKVDVATSIEFNFLISHQQSMWCESTVAIESISPQTCENREEVKRICDGIVSGIGSRMYNMHLLIEDSDMSQEHRVWRLQHRELQMPYPDVAVSFQDALRRQPPPTLIEKRRLALTFAYSLMQLHESPWFSSQWESHRMHFLPTGSPNGKVNLEKPFLSTSFDHVPQGPEPVGQHCMHRNSGILRLGILLIEIHKWQPLETLRREEDMIDGQPTPNTDMRVAERVLETLKSRCFYTYTDAINACLSLSWVPATLRVSLDDPGTLRAMYRHIIKPLEEEVNYGSSTTMLAR